MPEVSTPAYTQRILHVGTVRKERGMRAKIGDWVRFMRGGKLVIGKVEYLEPVYTMIGAQYHTDVGSVHDEYVLEVRSAEASRD